MEKKVLFTASTFSHIVRFHRPYLRSFLDLGWTVDVACGGTPLEIPEARRTIPLPFEKSMTAPANLRAALLLRRELRDEDYILISTHTSLAAFFTRLAAIGSEAAVINTCHGYLFDRDTPILKRTVLLAAEKLTAGRTDLLVTMNRFDREIAERYHLGRQLAEIPGMGVDFSPYDRCPPEAGPALRRELGLSPDAFVLIYPAEFSSRKSQETLLRALVLLPKRVHLLLPGDGALLPHCQALARELGVEARVRFPGNIADMAPWYASADCAISSSRSEGLPFNVMEAMYHRLPVVVSAVKGHEDLIRDEENGLLFPFGDHACCAARVRTLLDDPALVRRLGETAGSDAERLRLERVLPLAMEVYLSVLPVPLG